MNTYLEEGIEPLETFLTFNFFLFSKLIKITPDIKPAICAAYATPLDPSSFPLKLINWNIIQPPRTIKALILNILKNMIKKKKLNLKKITKSSIPSSK